MYFCKKCNKSFKKPTSLAAHTVFHSMKFIKCPLCKEKHRSTTIKEHIKSHEKDNFCLFCKKPVHGNKFCSHSCSAKFNNRARGFKERASYKCIGCDNKIIKWKFCSVKCRKDFKYKTYISRWLLKLESGNSGDQVNSNVKKWLFERADNSCEGILDNGNRCSWSRKNKYTGRYPLCAHHKDGNFKNTTPDNLELLCPNCHSLTENYGSRNKGNGRESRTEWRKNKKQRVSPNGMALGLQPRSREFDSPNPQ